MKPTIKQIRAALAAATPGPWCFETQYSVVTGPEGEDVCRVYHECNVEMIENAPEWLAWCLDQIERRDAMILLHQDKCDERDERCYGCKLCAEAQKLMEESK